MPRGARGRMQRKRGVPYEVVAESRRAVYKAREERAEAKQIARNVITRDEARQIINGDNATLATWIRRLPGPHSLAVYVELAFRIETIMPDDVDWAHTVAAILRELGIFTTYSTEDEV